MEERVPTFTPAAFKSETTHKAARNVGSNVMSSFVLKSPTNTCTPPIAKNYCAIAEYRANRSIFTRPIVLDEYLGPLLWLKLLRKPARSVGLIDIASSVKSSSVQMKTHTPGPPLAC